MAYFWLTPPSRAVFIISVFLALLSLLVRYAHAAIPVVAAHTFETLLAAFLLLLAGNLFRGVIGFLSRADGQGPGLISLWRPDASSKHPHGEVPQHGP